MVDNVIQQKTRTTREFASFYTKSDPILTYMVDRLEVKDDDVILEPAAGDGVFIEKILQNTSSLNCKIEALDLNIKAVDTLHQAFSSNSNVEIRQADTLLDISLDLLANANGYYTKVIGNPPYGAWQDYDKRSILKKKYKGYVKETYTLFIERCLDLLRPNGKLVFIVPDTFLALHAHKNLRKKLLTTTNIEEILLIPTRFFPGVNFGYSNLCIITLKKAVDKKNKIKVVSIQDDVLTLYDILKGDYEKATYFYEPLQADIANSLDYSFLLGANDKVRDLINISDTKLGELADCVTGFYSGNNSEFIAITDIVTKQTKNLPVIDKSQIDFDYLQKKDIKLGLTNGKSYIPIIKGGRGIIEKETDAYVLWKTSTVEFYKKDKKARFQNSSYYFRDGIGVPMVKTKRINAFKLNKRLFDQSIVGIFPKDEKYSNYILAFLNSNTCNLLLNTINHTANNSSNYLKKLPIIVEAKAIKEADRLINSFLKQSDKEMILQEINQLFFKLYSF